MSGYSSGGRVSFDPTNPGVPILISAGEHIIPASAVTIETTELTEAGEKLVNEGAPEEWVREFGGEYVETVRKPAYDGTFWERLR